MAFRAHWLRRGSPEMANRPRETVRFGTRVEQLSSSHIQRTETLPSVSAVVSRIQFLHTRVQDQFSATRLLASDGVGHESASSAPHIRFNGREVQRVSSSF